MFVSVTLTWGPEYLSAFQQLKHDVLEGVRLKHPDYSNPFVLEIDTVRGGLSVVLSQEVEWKLRPIYFSSRNTNSAETNYPAHCLEFLGLRWAVASKSKDYLQYSKLKVMTDSIPLSYIIKKINVDAVSQRLA